VTVFVVRLSVEGDLDDMKVYEKRVDAENRFWAGWFQIKDYPNASAGLYEVPEMTGAREAVALVKGKDPRVILIETRSSSLGHLSIDLSDVTL
jgi:hypothetical protein